MTSAPLLKVGGIRLLRTGINAATDTPLVVYDMKLPVRSVLVAARDLVDAIEVTFINAPVDPDSVVVNQTLIVRGPQGLVPGQKVIMPGNRVRFSVAHEVEARLREGMYEVALIGSGASAIRSAGDGKLALDGEINATWPSGNDSPGGDFVFIITVAP